MLNEAVDRIEALARRTCALFSTQHLRTVRGERVVLVENGRSVSDLTIQPRCRSAADEYGV